MDEMTARRSPESTARGPVRVHLASLGCAKNLVDSERLLGRLASAGALVGATADEADVIIVNTCGFIGPAKKESVETILEYLPLKKRDRRKRLFVMGCLAERYTDELRTELPEVDGVFRLDQHEAIVRACGLKPDSEEDSRLLLTPSHTAYLRIADGCDNRCTYCTIPQIRGPFRSRPADEILLEAEQLVAGGVRELTLIGQDTTSYGKDLTDPTSLSELLDRLAGIHDLRWLRLLYTHPAHFTDGLIEAYAEIFELCPYVDLPLQHLDDRILRRMGRDVTQTQSLRLIERLRSRVPDIALRTTFIVGFPGESRGTFNELLRWVERIGFDHLGVFCYSAEEGTPAARMPDQVSERAKTRRRRELMQAQQKVAFAKNRTKIGQIAEVLIDRPTDEPDFWVGRTRTQAPDVDSVTFIRGGDLRVGAFVEAQIVDLAGYDLVAQA